MMSAGVGITDRAQLTASVPFYQTSSQGTSTRGLDDVYIVSYGDEIHLPPVPLTNDEFAKWLTDRGHTPQWVELPPRPPQAAT